MRWSVKDPTVPSNLQNCERLHTCTHTLVPFASTLHFSHYLVSPSFYLLCFDGNIGPNSHLYRCTAAKVWKQEEISSFDLQQNDFCWLSGNIFLNPGNLITFPNIFQVSIKAGAKAVLTEWLMLILFYFCNYNLLTYSRIRWITWLGRGRGLCLSSLTVMTVWPFYDLLPDGWSVNHISFWSAASPK